jgi:hypothetical protein
MCVIRIPIKASAIHTTTVRDQCELVQKLSAKDAAPVIEAMNKTFARIALVQHEQPDATVVFTYSFADRSDGFSLPVPTPGTAESGNA